MVNISKKITLFLKDGLPKGVREATIDQWGGGAVCGPRNKIEEILKSEELNGPCVYFLIGDSDESDLLNVYVGEADSFSQRVKDHLRKKDWWQHVAVFFGHNNNPSKTGIEYLESHIYLELLSA
ncbi:MAG: GIY-YIG nuclease family protein, partial [Candidatus Roizmanbacteria bacterium]|nr:GIY-YIG nuclease family protein [Candidatus Roizmanbacteria bacterium]